MLFLYVSKNNDFPYIHATLINMFVCCRDRLPEDSYWRVSHRRSLLKGLAAGSAVSRHFHGNFTLREKCGRKRFTSNRSDCGLERIVKQSRFKNLRELHKEWTEYQEPPCIDMSGTWAASVTLLESSHF